MMTTLTASNNPIFFDKEAPATSGLTEIKYQKERSETLWGRTYKGGGGWEQYNLHVLTGRGDEAQSWGSYTIGLKPGEKYEVHVYSNVEGPHSANYSPVSKLEVHCLVKDPEAPKLIVEGQGTHAGGTWSWHSVVTRIPTEIVLIGVSRTKPLVDSNGIPRIQMAEGRPTAPLTITHNHEVPIVGLLPGHHYYFVVLVKDAFGNWDVRQDEFTCWKRSITVLFDRLKIINDGDGSGAGDDCEFWFVVEAQQGVSREFRPIKTFHLPKQDRNTADDFPLLPLDQFQYLGVPEVVDPEWYHVFINSSGVERDGWLEDDEWAGPEQEPEYYIPNLGEHLPFPVGPDERVRDRPFRLHCTPDPIQRAEDSDLDFEYEVTGRWSVEYEP